MHSDASFSGMEQKHFDESSYEMSSENEIDKKIVLRGIWDISSKKRADQIPFNIDGTKCSEIQGKDRSYVLNKSRDGCPSLDLIGLALNLSNMMLLKVIFPVQIFIVPYCRSLTNQIE